jgi:excisionase family DNA binding protein
MSAQNGNGQILTAVELARRWSVGKDWVYAQVRAGELPAIPLPGKLVRFRLDVIEAFERGEVDGAGRPVERAA